MTFYKDVYSSGSPQAIEITDTKVFVATNVREEGLEYVFDLTEYDKNEYIQSLAEQNSQLQTELLDTQSALCDVYEIVIGG